MMNEHGTEFTVAYLGPEGTYTHTALLNHFGQKQKCLPKTEIPDVFTSVEAGECEFGVVPVENSTEGSVTITLDRISNSNLKVCAELTLPIHHFFMVNKEVKPGEIKTIVSHQQSLGQCREWLRENYPSVLTRSVSSNAEAARIVSQQPDAAAIAGKTAADIYALHVLAKNIEDVKDNTTRFWLLSRDHETASSGKDKTSIIISTHNEPGTLFFALEPFQRFGVNLTKLESRPSRKQVWSYSFYLDVEGHVENQSLQNALNELKKHALDVKLLGSYPVAK